MAGPRLLFSKRGPFYGMIDKPNSVPLRAAAIYLGAPLPAPSSNLPGACVPPFPDPLRGFVLRTALTPHAAAGRALPRRASGGMRDAARVTPWAPYLVLHPVGFSVPVPSPAPRCALTAPFHPCLIPDESGPSAVCFLWHCPAPARPCVSTQGYADGWLLATTVPCGVRTFLPACAERSPDHSIFIIQWNRRKRRGRMESPWKHEES